LLPAGATQVFGPIDPLPVDLDVVVERGPGVEYRALCTQDMAPHIAEVAAGHPQRIPERLIVARGVLSGSGTHSATLHVEQCRYYLVVASANGATTVVALRLRAAAG